MLGLCSLVHRRRQTLEDLRASTLTATCSCSLPLRSLCSSRTILLWVSVLFAVHDLSMTDCQQVVLAVARVFYYLGLPSDLPKIVPPLLRLLHVSPEVERVILRNLALTSTELSVSVYEKGELDLCSEQSVSQEVLAKSYTQLLVRADDHQQVKKDKVRLLRAVVNVDNYPSLLREFIVSPQ